MSLQHAVNLSSLRIIREELDATLQRGSGEFEAYLADPGNPVALSQCRQDIAQIGGTLRLIQFPGAALLADEMAASVSMLMEAVAAGQAAAHEATLSALSHAFVALPRYLDFVVQQRSELPILVLPWVNELRAARREPFVPEYHFETWRAPALGELNWPRKPMVEGSVKRLRTMFQTGLVAAINTSHRAGGQGIGATGALMARAALRLSELFPATAGGGILPLLAAVTDALAQGQLRLNLNRRRSLARAEQLLGRLVRQGASALDEVALEPLRSELLFMLALVPAAAPSLLSQSLGSQVGRAFGLTPLQPDDAALSVQYELMRGPGGDTIDSVVGALRDELHTAKETLEIGAQNQGLLDTDLLPLHQTLTRIADTLKVLNLNAPALVLSQQLPAVDRWRGRSGQVPLEEFQQLAEALLFVESCLSALARHQLDPSDLLAFDTARRDDIIAASHLAEAKAIVIQEAQGSISMTKRAIVAYVESGFDRTHIANVTTTLHTVRGGLAALGYGRAAAVVRGCAAFVEQHQNERRQASPETQQSLETLADALVSLEYYLVELEAGDQADKTLALAEESLAALGFAAATGS